jgi:hypothetical protein
MPDDDGSYLPELRLVLRLLSESRGQAIMDYVAARRPRQEARLDQFADEAEAASGLTFEALLQRSIEDDSRSDLTQEVLEQASRTVAEVKMRALGRALALGLLADDDAAVDEVNLMLTALRDLEVPHIRVLHRLYSEGTRYEGIVDYELASMFRNGTQVLYPILKTLERHGLAGDLSGTPMNRPVSEFADPDRARVWAIWDFGILLIDRLLEVGEADATLRDR